MIIMTAKVVIPTFVKWAGGKRKLIPDFKKVFPEKIERYHEPFIGGGAVGFYVLKVYKPKEAYFSDINEELINCYSIIKNDVQTLSEELDKLKGLHSKETYYKVRAEDPRLLSPLTRAARFIYLNKTCFNGLYRVNSKNQFNVPIGSYKNPEINRRKDLQEISKLLKGVLIEVTDFSSVLKRAKSGDFVYFDPPYFPLSKTSSFTSYTKEGFGKEGHIKLADTFRKLDKMGCKVMLSNSYHPFVEDLYKEFNVKKVKAARAISCNPKGRGKIIELLITNY